MLSKKLTAWQIIVITMMYLYAARNFSTLVGLASPDPLTKMYDATYFRATWVLTALDAGFWTAMKISNKKLRDLASVVFSVFYLIAAEQADEKVRKVRGNITIDHLRVSWNKGTQSPYLRFFQNLLRPTFMQWPPRPIRIHRPDTSDYKETISAWLYFNGNIRELKDQTNIILDIPGGGFVAMDPRCSDDKLLSWAAKTGVPIVSLDYKKAPEYPYPYALNECYDAYTSIINTRGHCIGLSGEKTPNVIITGDSAGGNLATATTIMIIESGSSPVRRFQGQSDLPIPSALVLFYPALDMNIGSWMSDEQMSLIKDRQMRRTNKRIIHRKAMQYDHLVGTPHASDDEDDSTANGSSNSRSTPESEQEGLSITPPTDLSSPSQHECSPAPEYAHSTPTTFSQVHQGPPATPTSSETTSPTSPSKGKTTTSKPNPKDPQGGPHGSSHHPSPMRTRLAMSSMISYFNDRVLTPEMMRAMVILYVGPHNRPDFTQDYLLSPILAPDSVLARFPKTYFLTGERDPLVDDTIIFAGRLRRVKEAEFLEGLTLGGSGGGSGGERKGEFDDKRVAEVMLLPGVSHGFLQFPSLYPPGWKLIERSAGWVLDVFRGVEKERRREAGERSSSSKSGVGKTSEGRSSSIREREKERQKGEKGKEEEEGSEDEGLIMMAERPRGRARVTQGGVAGGEKKGDKKGDGTDKAANLHDALSFTVGDDSKARSLHEGNGTATDVKANGKGRADLPDALPKDGETLSSSGADGKNGEGNGSVGKKHEGSSQKKNKKKKGKAGKGKSDDEDRSLVRLASSEDLLARRMHGLAGGLTGLHDDSE